MIRFSEFAPAKVNLTLEVLGKRADGYHELRSLVAFASIGDRITLDTAGPVAVDVTGPFAAGIVGDNLVETALRNIASAEPQLRLGTVHLEKNLPVAAGIGGGSADAAAVIRAVRRANAEPGLQIDWSSLALQLGADVPVCLSAQAAWMTGIGDIIAPICGLPALNALLVNPLQPMPVDKTARVFRALSAGTLPSGFIRDDAPDAAHLADLTAFVARRGNSLQQPACLVAPIIRDLLKALADLPGLRYSAVSGGGPTCFGIFDRKSDVEAAAEHLRRIHPDWWIVPTELA